MTKVFGTQRMCVFGWKSPEHMTAFLIEGGGGGKRKREGWKKEKLQKRKQNEAKAGTTGIETWLRGKDGTRKEERKQLE